jgi:hypothetical protein
LRILTKFVLSDKFRTTNSNFCRAPEVEESLQPSYKCPCIPDLP